MPCMDGVHILKFRKMYSFWGTIPHPEPMKSGVEESTKVKNLKINPNKSKYWCIPCWHPAGNNITHATTDTTAERLFL